MAKKKLYLMCGPAGAGKTTWIRCNAEAGTSAHISRDRIRFNMVKEDEYYFSREDEVYMEFTRQICSALWCEWVDSVYVDATHLTQKAREKLIHEIDSVYPAEYYDIIAVIVKPELEVCLAQNAQRKGRECVPERVICNMYSSFQHPLKDDLRYEMIIENDRVVYGAETN
jgi:predicted kinase